MEEKFLYGNIETKEENKVNVFRSEHNNSINTISGDNIYGNAQLLGHTKRLY